MWGLFVFCPKPERTKNITMYFDMCLSNPLMIKLPMSVIHIKKMCKVHARFIFKNG